MNTKDFVFSASSFKEYLQCGLKFKYRKIDRLEPGEVSTHHRWFGSLVHAAIYSAFATHGEGRKSLDIHGNTDLKHALRVFNSLYEQKPDKINKEIYDIVFDEVGEKPVGSFAPGKIKALSSDLTQKQLEKGWKKEGQAMVKNGIEIVKQLNVVEFERQLDWTLLDRKFIGYSDVIAKDNDGKLEFYDFKTSWNKISEFYLAKDFQFFLYSVALKDIHGLDYYPKGYYVHLRSGSLVPYILTPDIYSTMIKKYKEGMENLEYNIFFDDYDGFLCPFCDFKHICYGDGA